MRWTAHVPRVALAALAATSSTLAAAPAAAHPCGPDAPTTYLATTYDDAFPIHGVAGDRRVIFLVQPTAGLSRAPGVHAVQRVGGAHLGDLPVPPQGWAVPLSPHIAELSTALTPGELWVSDVRIPPAQALLTPAPALVQRYSYRLVAGRLAAQHDETWALPVNTVPPGAGLPDGFLYVGSLTGLPDGAVVITDTFTGGIWVADAFGDAPRLAMIDGRFGPAPVDVIHGVQRAPGGGLRPYAQRLPALDGVSIGPGIESVTYADLTDEVCVMPTAPGGLYCIPRAVLFDATVPPFAKSAAARIVLPSLPGLTDLTDGLVYDRFHPTSPWLYWHRAPSDVTAYVGSGSNTLRRVHLATGAIETVAQSNTCFDWTYEMTTLPPLLPFSPITHILSSVGQGPNNPDINLNLGGVAAYVAPTPVPITLVGAY